MSDLISREALLQSLYDNKGCSYETIINIEDDDAPEDIINKTLKGYRKILKEAINNQPTAYDIDDVLGRLEDIAEDRLHMMDWRGQSVAEDCIEIVKGAVKE